MAKFAYRCQEFVRFQLVQDTRNFFLNHGDRASVSQKMSTTFLFSFWGWFLFNGRFSKAIVNLFSNKISRGSLLSHWTLLDTLRAKKNRRRLNFEKRKTVVVMIFSTPYWISGTKEYTAQTVYEASKCVTHFATYLVPTLFCQAKKTMLWVSIELINFCNVPLVFWIA